MRQMKSKIQTLMGIGLFAGCSPALQGVGSSPVSADGGATHNFSQACHQEEAVKIVWTLQYQMKVPPPRIEWILRDKLTCWFNEGFLGEEGTCVGGASFASDFFIQVVDAKGISLSSGALAHELNHLRRFVESSDLDSQHKSDDWGESSKEGIVFEANEKLRQAGL